MIRAVAVIFALALANTLSFVASDEAQGQARSGGDLLFEEFDARPLLEGEKRFIQVALAHTGDYVGLFDGKWGRRSQEALEAYSMRVFGRFIVPNIVIARLVDILVTESERYGFENRRFDSLALEVRLPFGSLDFLDDAPFDFAWRAREQSLFVGLSSEGFVSPFQLHEKVSRDFGIPVNEYVVRKDDRLVTSHRTADGRTIYLRSDRGPRGWVSMLVISGADVDRALFQSIVSSFYVGGARSAFYGPMPRLVAIRSAAADAIAALDEEPRSGGQNVSTSKPPTPSGSGDRQSDVDETLGSGSGFYIDATHVITNNHVIEACDGLAASDGAPLLVVAQDAERDLALLRARDSASTWLSIADNDAALGANLFVLGYPFYQTLIGGITATRGVLSSRTGLAGSPNEFTLSAQIQPGNSGGPVMNRDGEVVGVVVARISDSAVAQLTGTIPQNINYAVSRKSLIAFLQDAAVTMDSPEGDGEPVSLEDGIPAGHEAAVVPITCLHAGR